VIKQYKSSNLGENGSSDVSTPQGLDPNNPGLPLIKKFSAKLSNSEATTKITLALLPNTWTVENDAKIH
jgi:hypothetical protein